MLPSRYTTPLACSLALLLFFNPTGRSFAPSAVVRTTNIRPFPASTKLNSPTLNVLAAALGGLADPAEQGEDLSRQSTSRNNSSFNPASWIQVDGGFLPNLPRPGRRTVGGVDSDASSLIRDVTNLADYKKVVVDETADKKKLTIVRFYAPWCRACKANQPLFQKLAAAYRHDPHVQFVQVPLTQETAVLQQGLGIPSLPYGHIYHHDAGLVEERKIGKTTFATFEKVLQTYVRGYCDVTYQEEQESSSSYDDNNNAGSGPLRP